MARTRTADAGEGEGLVEEEIDLGPEDDPTETDEAPEGDGDEAGGDADDEAEEGEGEEGLAEPPAPRRGGGSETVRALRRRAQEAEERAATRERELAEARGFQQGLQTRQADPQAAQRAEQEFYASLEMMQPAQAYQALMQRGQGQVAAALQQVEFRSNDRADKQAYDIAARSSKVHRDYRDQVEKILASERAQNRNPDREVILKVLIGGDVLERMSRAAPGQRAAGAARIASQRTRPTGAGSDAGRGGNRRPQPGTPEHDEMLVMQGLREGRNLFNE